jgi:alcohol dehydrogenase class IV
MTTKSEELYPDIALLNPSLLTSLPPAVTAATGMDSLTQAIEAYASPSASPITDALALDAIKMITESLKPAVLKSDRDALASMQVATTMEGIAFDNAGLGLVHGLSEPVSGKFHTSHGLTNAILLPHVLEFNIVACPQKYATLAEAMGVQAASCSRLELISGIIDRIKNIRCHRYTSRVVGTRSGRDGNPGTRRRSVRSRQ